MMSTTGARRSLCKAIVNAPIARNSPRLHAVVGARHTEILVQRFVPVFCNFGAGGLDRPQLVRAARHEDALLSVPIPVVAEAGMRHGKRRRPKVCILPVPAAVRRDF